MMADEFTFTKVWYDETEKALMGEFMDDGQVRQGVIQHSGVENRLGNEFTEDCLRKAAANFPELPMTCKPVQLKQIIWKLTQ